MWHVSIACQGKNGPVLISSLDTQTKRYMVNLAASLLEGVGSGENFAGAGDVAIHFRRALSYHEIEKLTHEWLAIPAIDMAGDLKALNI